MSQKQIEPKKCRITIQQLEKRFNEADLNKNGTLSADEITNLLQNLGYDDTYKGTIRKICRNLNKKKRLQDLYDMKAHIPSAASQDVPSKPQEQNEHKNQNAQEKRLRKEQKKKKQEEQAAIGFEEFAKYFQILEKPIGKILYNASLERAVKVAELCRQIQIKNAFHKDKGQKLKMKVLVGQDKPHYNSSFQISISKESKRKETQKTFKIEISIDTVSELKAQQFVNGLKEVYQTLVDIISAQNQELGNIPDVIKFDFHTEGKIAKIIVTTVDDDMKKLVQQILQTFDEVLETQVNFFLKILYQFNFNLSEIKNNKNSVLQDIFTRQCCLKIQYIGSQFVDALKEVFLAKDVFELLEYDKDPQLLMLLGFISMEKGDILLKFKDLERKGDSRQFTNEILSQMGVINEFQTQNFSFKKVSQIIDGPIIINAVLENVKLHVSIDIKDLLKLPFIDSYMGSDSGSDDE